ncbi:MAG: endolytic transglycosylase MltG [Pseudomonadales bacterium]|jgi:UPF0755 protein|nr:endolytic transglycosylase MltG [Gammaproteobacteria bacterium]MBP6050651.1 endolytic transglycosylase MltG [Pseudomonadales bacterium]MBK6585466.1 endolytic transglycosylase MltG [Gammaproteobacteria bacterium]MBK7168886.1 endolytic transglycosylase MltG [Gammaproteobacteria bacterium]MBK7521038.1 endolytic transglycosylase MltG [Gammaproteobacteria bacterium]
MWRGSSRLSGIGHYAPAALAAGVLSLFIACQALLYWLDKPRHFDAPELVELRAGTNLTVFLDDLGERGILPHPDWLRYYARLIGVADAVRAGEYLLEPGITPRGILQKLIKGEVVLYSVTIIEGTTVRQMLAQLHAQRNLQVLIDPAEPDALLQLLGADKELKSAEGVFFPDTYQFHAGMSDLDILKMSHQRMQQILEEEWQMRVDNLPYANSYEALVMASLVEKETGLASERPDIAGVFVRRLQRGMLLQTDPAVIYGVGSEFTGNLTRVHLQTPGPYNTYLNPGLPPSPIALPGRAAITAALHPAGGDTLYFVARGDGSHEFSTTLDAHNAAVRKFQIRKRAVNYRSRPTG